MSQMSPEQADAARNLKRSQPLYDPDYKPRERTHEEKTRLMLGWIVAFTGIVAVVTLVNFIVSVAILAS